MILKTDLYQHQRSAVDKLKGVKVGALYMEMGTGKTRTALELIKMRLDTDKVDRVLWLCPCSVKEDLRRGIMEHSDGDRIEICGIETLSSSIATNARLLEMVMNSRVYLIVDESNLVKNHMAYRTQNIIRLADQCTYKLILNGTPISRCEKDLFSQWMILDWRILGYRSFWSFAANHLEYDDKIPGKINRCLNVDYLVRKIAPYTYQIRKSECLDLPPKTYDTVYYGLTRAQARHYCDVADVMIEKLDDMKPSTIYRMFSALQSIISGYRVTVGDSLKREKFFTEPTDNPRIDKMIEVVQQMDDKVLIFCRYTDEITDVVNVLNDIYVPGSAVPFYGELNTRQREASLAKFRGASRFMVANKTCAGYGLNLQFCHHVVYYSNDFDYATRAQSEDRVHRIGQGDNVHIVDICCAGTLDERVLNCLLRKENLVERFKNEINRAKDRSEAMAKFVYRFRGKEEVIGDGESLSDEGCIGSGPGTV